MRLLLLALALGWAGLAAAGPCDPASPGDTCGNYLWTTSDAQRGFRTVDSSVDLTGTDFSVSFWIHRTDSVSFDIPLSHGAGFATSSYLHIGYRDAASGMFTMAFFADDLDVPLPGDHDVDRWVHWACVYRRSDNRRQVFRNGVLAGEDTAAAPYAGASGPIYVSGITNQAERVVSGGLDEVGVWTRLLSVDEIRAQHERAVYDTTGMTLRLTMDHESGVPLDSSPAARVLQENADSGTESPGYDSALAGRAAALDAGACSCGGSLCSGYFTAAARGDYLADVADTVDFRAGFTVTMWVRPVFDDENQWAFGKGDTADTQDALHLGLRNLDPAQVACGFFADDLNVPLAGDLSTLAAGEWHFLVCRHAGPGGARDLFWQDGDAPDASNTGTLLATGNMYVGRAFLDKTFLGDLDEVRVYTRPLSDAEIGAAYSRGEYPADAASYLSMGGADEAGGAAAGRADAGSAGTVWTEAGSPVYASASPAPWRGCVAPGAASASVDAAPEVAPEGFGSLRVTWEAAAGTPMARVLSYTVRRSLSGAMTPVADTYEVLAADAAAGLVVADLGAGSTHHFTVQPNLVEGAATTPSPAAAGLAGGCDLNPGAADRIALLEATSGISDGDLVLDFEGPRDLTSLTWAFVGAGGSCSSSGVTAGSWEHTDDLVDCRTRHTMTMKLPEALNECGFSAEPEDGGSVWYYEAVVEATSNEPGEDVFGQPTTVTKTTAFRVRVELPKSVDVSASAVAYGAVIQFALLSQQEVDTSTPTAAFKWTLVTSVQYPYELTAKEVTEETAHDFESLGLSLSAASVACPASGACTQTFEIAATESTSCELTDAELKSVFTIGCRSQFSGACDTPEGVETDTATFTVSTDSFCARVVEVATVTPTLTTSTSQGGASAIDFVLQTTLFGRVTFAIEAGLSVTGTRLLSLDLVSEETVQPVTGAGVQDSAVVSAISFLETDQGGTAPHLDFQFQLNTESVKFAVGGGQASLTITAVVEVTYDGAGSQRFEVQAVSGPGSMSTAASSTVGVSTPAAPGSASTAGSTVLGVSTGTAMIAGVGLVAVVALAAGAAVAARKHRASAAASRAAKLRTMHTAGASSSDLQLAAAPGAAPQIALDVSADLGAVQDAYGVTHAE